MADYQEKLQTLLERLSTSDDVVSARKLCTAFIQETDTLSFQRPTNMEELLSALLDGVPFSPKRAQSMFEQFSGAQPASYALMVGTCEKTSECSNAGCLSTLREIPHCWCFMYQERMVCLVEHFKTEPSFDTIHSVLLRNGYSFGISRPFSELSQLRTYYDQAFVTLKTLFILGRTPGCAQYDDYLMIRLLEGLRSEVKPHDFALPDVRYLQEYDKKHNTELGRTLLCYLERSKNVGATAETLHIHRNTVHYRVNKCMELLPELDFSNDYITFLLMLSLHIAEFDFYQDQRSKAKVRI